MFSQTAEYALRACIILAPSVTEARTATEIAEASKVPIAYLSKVLQSLSRAGLLVAQRGRGGGFVLSRPASLIRVLDIVNAVDPIRRITSCPLGLEAHAHALCPMHRTLDNAIRSVEEVFATTTLAALIEVVPQGEEKAIHVATL